MMAKAAKQAGVQHVVWASLEDTRDWVPLSDDRMPTLQDQWKVPHFDGKGVADQEFRDADVPTTFLRAAFYWENLIFFGMGPVRGEDGVLAITFPMGEARLPGIAAEDIGRCAYGVFKAGRELVGTTIGIAGDQPTVAEMAAALSRALGEEVRYNDVPPDVYRSFGFPGAEDVGNMFQFHRDFEAEFTALRDPDRARSLNPRLQDFESWAQANAKRIPIE